MTIFDQIYSEIAGQVEEHATLNFFRAQEKNPERRVVLYGAGENCPFALHVCCTSKNIHVDCICDTVRTGTYVYKGSGGTYVDLTDVSRHREAVTYKIISPTDLLADYQDAFVCITTWKYEKEIKLSLIQSGFPESQIFYFRNPYLITPEVFERNYLDGYRQAYESFTDERSKQRVVDRMRMYLLGHACPADSLFRDGYMAFPGIQVEDGEIYIDGGAYTGDTAQEFICNMDSAGKRYAHIYSFEPDPCNIKLAKKNLEAYEHVELVSSGLWSKPDVLYFASRSGEDHRTSGFADPADNDEASGESGLSIPVTSLDAFFKEKPIEEWPTLIKMDIEGSEREALIGAEKVIKTKKPRLMICAYHKPEDIYELPQTILKLRDDCQLSLWQISESFWDLMLYAI